MAMHKFTDEEHRRRVFRRIRFVDGFDGCWEWTASGNQYGYGQVWTHGRLVCVHRLMYEWFVGPIPSDLQIDHLCRNRGCCNPNHLEAVTRQENIRRGDAGKETSRLARLRTTCGRGHALTDDNIYRYRNERRCRACHRIHKLAHRERKAGLRAA